MMTHGRFTVRSIRPTSARAASPSRYSSTYLTAMALRARRADSWPRGIRIRAGPRPRRAGPAQSRRAPARSRRGERRERGRGRPAWRYRRSPPCPSARRVRERSRPRGRGRRGTSADLAAGGRVAGGRNRQLSQAKAAVVRRHALVAVDLEASLGELVAGFAREDSVHEHAAAENGGGHAGDGADTVTDGRDDVDERRVEP